MPKNNIFQTNTALIENEVTDVFPNNGKHWPEFHQSKEDVNLDHFVHKNGKVFAGTHLIIDLWGASSLDNLEQMENAMREAVAASKATLLHIFSLCKLYPYVCIC